VRPQSAQLGHYRKTEPRLVPPDAPQTLIDPQCWLRWVAPLGAEVPARATMRAKIRALQVRNDEIRDALADAPHQKVGALYASVHSLQAEADAACGEARRREAAAAALAEGGAAELSPEAAAALLVSRSQIARMQAQPTAPVGLRVCSLRERLEATEAELNTALEYGKTLRLLAERAASASEEYRTRVDASQAVMAAEDCALASARTECVDAKAAELRARNALARAARELEKSRAARAAAVASTDADMVFARVREALGADDADTESGSDADVDASAEPHAAPRPRIGTRRSSAQVPNDYGAHLRAWRAPARHPRSRPPVDRASPHSVELLSKDQLFASLRSVTLLLVLPPGNGVAPASHRASEQ